MALFPPPAQKHCPGTPGSSLSCSPRVKDSAECARVQRLHSNANSWCLEHVAHVLCQTFNTKCKIQYAVFKTCKNHSFYPWNVVYRSKMTQSTPSIPLWMEEQGKVSQCDGKWWFQPSSRSQPSREGIHMPINSNLLTVQFSLLSQAPWCLTHGSHMEIWWDPCRPHASANHMIIGSIPVQNRLRVRMEW